MIAMVLPLLTSARAETQSPQAPGPRLRLSFVSMASLLLLHCVLMFSPSLSMPCQVVLGCPATCLPAAEREGNSDVSPLLGMWPM